MSDAEYLKRGTDVMTQVRDSNTQEGPDILKERDLSRPCSVPCRGSLLGEAELLRQSVTILLSMARAAEQLAKRVVPWVPWCARHKLPRPAMRLLKMPKRWGSVGTDGRIALNLDLIHMPSRCIDYVVVHEICHLVRPRTPTMARSLIDCSPV